MTDLRTAPKTPQRAPGRSRVDQLLAAADRIVTERGMEALSLPAVAAAAGASPSSLYHFFPSLDALLVALLERCNADQDAALEAALAAASPATSWQALTTVLITAGRDFHNAHPTYAALMRQAGASPALRAADDAHIMALGARFAALLEMAFVLPPIARLPERLGLATTVADRIWAFDAPADGRISDFAFEESKRAVLSYLANYLPGELAPRERA